MNLLESIVTTQTDHFVTVPETTLPGGLLVPTFQIGVYAATRGEDGKATVRADGAPWVEINYRDAKRACEAAGYAAITETQWLAVAYNASQVASNWTGGKVGEGELFQGIRNWHVNSAQPGNCEPTDLSERRWLTLSNGEQVCDLNGNVYQWVVDDVQGDTEGIIARPFASDSPSRTTPPYPNRTHGMGDTTTGDWSSRALLRGGCWFSESLAGAFALSYDGPDGASGVVGFRCTK